MTPKEQLDMAMKLTSCHMTLESDCILLEISHQRGTLDEDMKVILDTAERVANELLSIVKEYRK